MGTLACNGTDGDGEGRHQAPDQGPGSEADPRCPQPHALSAAPDLEDATVLVRRVPRPLGVLKDLEAVAQKRAGLKGPFLVWALVWVLPLGPSGSPASPGLSKSRGGADQLQTNISESTNWGLQLQGGSRVA